MSVQVEIINQDATTYEVAVTTDATQLDINNVNSVETVDVTVADPTVFDVEVVAGSSSQVGSIYGTTNEVTVSNVGNVFTIGLPDDVTITDDLTVGGDLTVHGNTTIVNSTVIQVDDPVITLGGDTVPVADDNKDRGIEFHWHNGTSAKLGFFGFDDSTGKFTFIPDTTNTSEVFSGTVGEIDANIDWSKILNKPDPTITLSGSVIGEGTMNDMGNVTISTLLDPDAVSYMHEQISASATWTINHTLNFIPNVTVVDSAGTVVEGQCDYPDADTVVITFTSALAGKAYLS